ncbi:hypothetical protein HLI_03230 [Halobacillus litoralis]|uniref:Uncharacterized protein n=1 Tax=Halobacillus litoralis TaxID=45668 RepID=A0A410M973_9BACI|nr:hypothetical protein HLI_03230 [Halobacillus litoralis]
MKTSSLLVSIIIIMQFSTLINVTIFRGEWNGIILTLHTMLFILAIGIHAEMKKCKPDRAS